MGLAAFNIFARSVHLSPLAYYIVGRQASDDSAGPAELEKLAQSPLQPPEGAPPYMPVTVSGGDVACLAGRDDMVNHGFANITQTSMRASLSSLMPRPMSSSCKLWAQATQDA